MTTPIERARGLGPVSSRALRDAGIETVEQLQEMGWEEAFLQLVEHAPRFVNLNMAAGLIGAVDDVDWREISPAQKARAKALVERLRRTRG